MNHSVLLFVGTFEDQTYAPRLKPLVGQATVFTRFKEPQTIAEIILYCKSRNITGVFSTSTALLLKLLAFSGNIKTKASLDNYQGSFFSYQGIEFVFISPLKQLLTVPYGAFLAKRFISKLINKSSWQVAPAFQYSLITPTNYEEIFNEFQTANLISVDIETFKNPLSIRCVGYTAAFITNGTLRTRSIVIPCDSDFNLSVIRKFNWELQAPKVFQNGKYDVSYLLRFNAPVYNYLYDTVNMFHSWYSELPKDLAFLGAFFVRESIYWKDLAETSDLDTYYRYNALDTWVTILTAIAWILEAPAWAKRNYLEEFPVVYPCILSEMTGIKRDIERLEKVAGEYTALIDADNVSLSKMVGTYPNIFNTNSAPQNAALRKILGCADIESSDEKSLKKIASRHPLNARIANKILDIRGNRKLTSTYLKVGTERSELNGRILYAINPHGTDTGRMASREHHFWCGLQIQNINRGEAVKQTFIADDDFLFAECDLKQAETWDTAYISGDRKLIEAVNSPRDFHATNASAFFGVPYYEIYSDELKKTLDKALRDLSKRVNHGANYLMGALVLIDTMGEELVWKAKKLLGLPKSYGLKDVAEHLLRQFHLTYPYLSSNYYPAVVQEVVTTHMLVSHTSIRTPKVYDVEPIEKTDEEWMNETLEGWARYCFGKPHENKLDKNSLVAHASQSLNAKSLNVAFLRVFYEIAINPKHRNNFKLLAQIHDSIFFQFRKGHEYLADMVRERMEVPIRILSYDKVERIFTVPADIKAGKDGKGAYRWSETE